MNQKKILLNENENKENIRLNKFLSDCGICSRREADRLISEGKVSVNGKTALMGQRVSGKDLVVCNGKKAVFQEKLIILLLNKPEGIECTADKNNPDNIMDFLNYSEKLFYVGRLDKNSCGLLMFTNDGDLANRISKSVNYHEKEYVVRVNKKITDDFIKNMSEGVSILDTVTRKCKVKRVDDFTFNIILTQGLNRQIRRMCEKLGYKVKKLKRIRIINMELGNLKEGSYRMATEEEIKKLLDIVR